MRQGIGIVMGLVMVAVALFMFPMVVTGANEIIGHANISNFTGLDDIAAIAPTVIFLALIFGGGYMTVRSVRSYKRKAR